LTKPEVSAVFRKFDRDGDGNVNYDEFLRGVRAAPSPQR
jgi:Ca2+-binding EF-hand superfamily protein